MPGWALRQPRIRAGLEQGEAAEQLGVSKSYLSHLEAGRRPVTAAIAAKAMEVYLADAESRPLFRVTVVELGPGTLSVATVEIRAVSKAAAFRSLADVAEASEGEGVSGDGDEGQDAAS